MSYSKPSIIVSTVRPGKNPENEEDDNNKIRKQADVANTTLSSYSDDISYLNLPTADDIDKQIKEYKGETDADDCLVVVFVGHGGVGGKCTERGALDDEDDDGYIYLENRDPTGPDVPYYDDQYVNALNGIGGSVVTIALSCFSGGFTDDLERANIKGIHISSTSDEKYSYAGAFSTPFFEAVGNNESLGESFEQAVLKDRYANESYWNEIVPKENYYYENETEIIPYMENETRRDYYKRRWGLDPLYIGAEQPNVVKVRMEDIKLQPKKQPVPQAGLVPRTGSNLIPVPLDGERPPM